MVVSKYNDFLITWLKILQKLGVLNVQCFVMLRIIIHSLNSVNLEHGEFWIQKMMERFCAKTWG